MPRDRLDEEAPCSSRRWATRAHPATLPGAVHRRERRLAVAHDEESVAPAVAREDPFDCVQFGLLVARSRRERTPVRRDAIPRAPRRGPFPGSALAPGFHFVLATVNCVRILDAVRTLDGEACVGHVLCLRCAYVPALLGLHADLDADVRHSPRRRLFHVSVPHAEP